MIDNHTSTPVQIDAWQGSGVFSGYASVFGVIDSQTALKRPRHHDTSQPVGKITALREDAYGLWMQGELLLHVQQGKEAFALLKQEAIKGLSIGYSPLKWQVDADTGIRFLYEVDLWEVSVVTFPANEMAGVVV